jgi:exodeoxyribonuclease III
MKIATWNVNSIRARLERLLAWLAKEQPDALCLQELKVPDADFPMEELAEAGYAAAVHGQRTYNGVAILARGPLEDVVVSLADREEPTQARLLAATVAGVRVISAYVPNGSEVGSDKYAYKLEWLERLSAYLKRTGALEGPFVLCGDLNIAPDDLDIAKPDEWQGTVLSTDEVRGWYRGLLEAGLVDVVRKHNPDGGIYSWWDYRRLGFQRNDGLRIDHILATAPLAERCTAAWVDRDERKGEKPSDHAPVVAEFRL